LFAFSPSAVFFKRHLPEGASVLDLGCGQGHALFSRIGGVIGVDLAMGSLLRAKQAYKAVVRGNVLRLPFADGTFDCVISQDLVGHIPREDKEGLISEIKRVLKNGGRTAHYIETAGNNPVERLAMRSPELYRKYFIEKDGHNGLEPASLVVRRFRDAGFRPLAEKKWASTFLRFPKEYIKRFDNEYVGASALIAAVVKGSRVITRIRALERLVEASIVALDWFFEKFSPLDGASGIYVCYQKQE